MKKLMNESDGFSTVEIVLIVVFVALISFVGWYVAKQRNTTKLNNSSQSPATSTAKELTDKISNASASDSTVVVPPAQTQQDLQDLAQSNDSITYSSKTLKFSFKYPSSWDQGKKNWDSDSVTLTSPSKGILLSYADSVEPSTSNCSTTSSKYVVNAVKKVSLSGAPKQLYLVDLSIKIDDGPDKGKFNKYVALTDWNGSEPKVGESDKCPPYNPSFQSKDSSKTSWFRISDISDDYRSKSVSDFFNLPEVEVVRQIILSSKYN